MSGKAWVEQLIIDQLKHNAAAAAVQGNTLLAPVPRLGAHREPTDAGNTAMVQPPHQWSGLEQTDSQTQAQVTKIADSLIAAATTAQRLQGGTELLSETSFATWIENAVHGLFDDAKAVVTGAGHANSDTAAGGQLEQKANAVAPPVANAEAANNPVIGDVSHEAAQKPLVFAAAASAEQHATQEGQAANAAVADTKDTANAQPARWFWGGWGITGPKPEDGPSTIDTSAQGHQQVIYGGMDLHGLDLSTGRMLKQQASPLLAVEEARPLTATVDQAGVLAGGAMLLVAGIALLAWKRVLKKPTVTADEIPDEFEYALLQ